MKHDIQSLITDENNDYNIDIHQKIWIDNDNFKDTKRYNKFFDKSFLHSFDFEIENLSFDKINFDITDITHQWLENFLSHSFDSEHTVDPIQDIEFNNKQELESDSVQDRKTSNKVENSPDIKPGLRMALANTLRFDQEMKYKFDIIDDTQVPFTPIAYFKDDTNGEQQESKEEKQGHPKKYLKSDINVYKYMEYQDHQIVVIPFKNNDNVSLILSLPILDQEFILNDKVKKKYDKQQRYMRYSIHPHDLHSIFDSVETNDMFKVDDVKDDDVKELFDSDNEDKKENVNVDDEVLHNERMQLYLPKIDKEFHNELKDHHIVACGLNTFWLPLYYGKLCLKSLDCKSYLNIDGTNAKFELASIAYFDEEQRVWFAMRWKYGLRDIALKMNWYNIKQNFRWRRKEKIEDNEQTKDDHKTIVFDRPFDYYLYDSFNRIVYASGTITAS